MAKEKYTDDEWFLVSTLPPMIGSAVAAIDKSGFFGTFREMTASMESARSALTQHAENPLISDVLKGDGTTFKEVHAAARERQAKLLERAKEKGIRTAEQHADLVVEDCAEAARLVDSREEPAHAQEYKEWACSIGLQVAEAAKEGGIFGFGAGDAVSDKESELLSKIQDALGCG